MGQIVGRPVGRPVGRGGGGFEGVRSNPSFGPQKTAIVHFKCPTGPLVSLLLRITTVQASLVAAVGLFLEDQHRTRCVYCLATPLRRKLHVRPRINTCVNKLLCQALESSPVVLLSSIAVTTSTVLATLVPSLVEI